MLDRSLVDFWVKTKDAASFHIARELIKEEGFLCGGSTGSNVLAALGIAKQLGPNCRRVVTIAPDSIRNYMWGFLKNTKSNWSFLVKNRHYGQLNSSLYKRLFLCPFGSIVNCFFNFRSLGRKFHWKREMFSAKNPAHWVLSNVNPRSLENTFHLEINSVAQILPLILLIFWSSIAYKIPNFK